MIISLATPARRNQQPVLVLNTHDMRLCHKSAMTNTNLFWGPNNTSYTRHCTEGDLLCSLRVLASHAATRSPLPLSHGAVAPKTITPLSILLHPLARPPSLDCLTEEPHCSHKTLMPSSSSSSSLPLSQRGQGTAVIPVLGKGPPAFHCRTSHP